MQFYLAANHSKDRGLRYTRKLQEYIQFRGGNAMVLETTKDEYGNYHFDFPRGPEGMVLVLGGDGTILQCANDLNLLGFQYPMLGINLGTLGFLTSVEREDAFTAVDELIDGEYTLESYPLLSAELKNDRVNFCQQALNDVVLGRQGFARVVPLTVTIDGCLAYQANCDGIVVSTALGSTAYNISLGGPVVPPGTPVFLITPIAPHLPGIRPIIVPDTAEITIEFSGSKGGLQREGLVTCDGRSNGIWLEAGDRMVIRKHKTGGQLLRLTSRQKGFFPVFREKLLTMR